MKYRIMVAWTFNNEDTAMLWWGRVKERFPLDKAGEDDYASIHKCYHDEDPVKPCEIIEELP